MKSSFGYFCTGTFAMVVSLVAYIFLERLVKDFYYQVYRPTHDFFEKSFKSFLDTLIR